MKRKIAGAFGYAKPAPAAWLEPMVRKVRRLAARGANRRSVRRRTAFAVGAALALPVAYRAVRRLRG